MDIDWNSENKIAQSAFYETMQFNFAIQMLNVFYLEFEIYIEMIGANMKKVDNLCSAGPETLDHRWERLRLFLLLTMDWSHKKNNIFEGAARKIHYILYFHILSEEQQEIWNNKIQENCGENGKHGARE